MFTPDGNFDVVRFLLMLKRFWILILALFLVGSVAGGVIAKWGVRPTYEARTSIYAWPDNGMAPENEQNESKENVKDAAERLANLTPEEREVRLRQRVESYRMLSTQLALGNLLLPDFQALLSSRKLKQSLNKKLLESFPAEEIGRYTLSAKPINKTRFVEVVVQCKNQKLAPIIANEAVSIFADEARAILGINNTKTIDAAIDEMTVLVAPNPRKYIIFGAFLGLLLGVGIGFCIEFFDKSIRDVKQLEDLTQLPILGVLPEVSDIGKDNELYQQDNKSMFGEAIRSLRVNVEYLLPANDKAKVFLITSVGKGEGKSGIFTSLACAMAQIEKKVLLIDSDLRRPRLHRVFRLSNKLGLVDILANRNSKFEEIVNRGVVLPNMDVLTSGTIPITPGDLLSSARLENFIAERAKEYDYIFFDAPPCLGFVDPVIISKLVDSTLIACDCISSNTDKIKATVERLRKANIHIGGLILNRFSLQNKNDYYYYDYHYAADGLPDPTTKRKVKKMHRHHGDSGSNIAPIAVVDSSDKEEKDA